MEGELRTHPASYISMDVVRHIGQRMHENLDHCPRFSWNVSDLCAVLFSQSVQIAYITVLDCGPTRDVAVYSQYTMKFPDDPRPLAEILQDAARDVWFTGSKALNLKYRPAITREILSHFATSGYVK